MEKNNLLMFSPNHKIKIKYMQKKKIVSFFTKYKKWSVIDGKNYKNWCLLHGKNKFYFVLHKGTKIEV